MKKSDLISLLSTRENLTHVQAAQIVDLIFDGFTDALAKNERIEIRGFANFVNRNYETRTGRNPKTGESVAVKPKRLPYFKVGKEMKEKINGSSSRLRKMRPSTVS
jgi:integration host factor subunit beta